MRQPFIRLLLLCTLVAGLHNDPQAQITYTPFAYSITKMAFVSHGAVVSAHPLASNIGASILQQGGNAFDAAIATQLALAVVYPGAGNIGGGGFMVAPPRFRKRSRTRLPRESPGSRHPRYVPRFRRQPTHRP